MMRKLSKEEFVSRATRDLREAKYRKRITGSIMARDLQIRNCIATKKALSGCDSRRVNCGRC